MFSCSVFGRYSLAPAIAAARKCQEMTVEKDCADKIIAVAYDSGAEVRINETYSVVKNSANGLWLGDRFGMWHPID